MRAVWSFWTKPYLAARRSSWSSEFHHWLAWGLSLAAAQRHYPDTALVTDDAGARLLVDTLDLPFAHVSTALNRLDREDPGWWALGKLEAYRIQKDPFVHLDTDVFLWKALPPTVETADVLAQNPEPIVFGQSCYCPENFEVALTGGWLPVEWRWYRRAAPILARAECCGIFGGTHLDFIHSYAGQALRLLRHPCNRAAWTRFHNKAGNMILVEQYLLTACLEYHRALPGSRFTGIDIGYLFNSMDEAYRAECATAAGFTHLAAGAKLDPGVARDLKLRVQRDLPQHFARCADMAKVPLITHCEGAGRRETGSRLRW